MQYRQLGRSCGLRISPLTFGTITFGGAHGMEHFGAVDVATARRMFDLCLEYGINMIDTANMYSLGIAEEIAGEALDDPRYNELMVTSKVRMVVGDGPNDGGQSRWHILDQVDKSLRRLRRDHLDLYYLHEWDGQTPLEETLQTMDGLVRSGKVRYYGVSNYTAWQLMKTLMVCERHGFIKPVAQQIYYTPQAREAEYEMIPAAADQGVANQIWSPLAMGLLTGKYRRGQPQPPGARQTEGNWTDVRVGAPDNLYDMVEVLDGIAAEQNATIPQVVLAWVMARPSVSSVVVGARTVEQWQDSLGALKIHLTDEQTRRIDNVSPPAMLYPHWPPGRPRHRPPQRRRSTHRRHHPTGAPGLNHKRVRKGPRLMQITTLGHTGLQVSRIAFGTWQLGGEWGSFDEQQAISAIRHARELGVNFFDTAQAYGFGKSEEVLATALRSELDRNRDDLVIATKGGVKPGGERPRDARRDFLREGVESSLRALKLDHIDLYQVHWPDEQTPAEETAAALQELVDEGKIRHVGVSNYTAAQMVAFDRTRPVETLQPPYHLFRRGIEDEVLPYTREHNIGVLTYSPLASGL